MAQDSIHLAAQEGYSRSGQLYETGRSAYPPEAIQHLASVLGVIKESKVLDLAAGTGKFTKQMSGYSDHLTAVEPVREMRLKLSEQIPNIDVLEGTAERIPAADGSFDQVFVATDLLPLK